MPRAPRPRPCLLAASRSAAASPTSTSTSSGSGWTAPAPSTSPAAPSSGRPSRACGRADDPEGTATREAARALFERSGPARPARHADAAATGGPTSSSSADFTDVNRLSRHAGLSRPRASRLRPEGERLAPRGTLVAARRGRPAHRPTTRRPHGRALPPAEQGVRAQERRRRRRAREHRGLAPGRGARPSTGRPLDVRRDHRLAAASWGRRSALFAAAIAAAPWAFWRRRCCARRAPGRGGAPARG